MSNCLVCKSIINSNRRGIKYCSNACKQRAYNARKSGIQVIETNASNLNHYCFKDYLKAIGVLGEGFDIPYIEYSFIRSCHPHITDLEDVIGLVRNSVDTAYNAYPEAEKIYQDALNKYQKAVFESSFGERVSK